MNRLHQVMLIVSTIAGSWLGMQAVHELGHACTIPAGFLLWHRQGPHFGLGPAGGNATPSVAYASLVACATLLILDLLIGGE